MIELTAIFIAGGAGLLMGYKLFVPGQFSRGYQLKQQAKRSVQLLLGTIPLFVIAGIIEGFITPAAISLEAKYIVAILTVIGLILYVVIGKLLLMKKDRLHIQDFDSSYRYNEKRLLLQVFPLGPLSFGGLAFPI